MTTDETALARLIVDEIAASGPMTFARFMELALYEPTRGYYRQSRARTTREGDFLTAPEMHPIFGWTLAREIDRLWQELGCPRPFRLLEYAAGSGALGLAVFEGLRRAGSDLAIDLQYDPVEINEHRIAELEREFDRAGLADRLVNHRRPSSPGPGGASFVLANEFLDALPVHRVVSERGTVRELFVDGRDGDFVEVPGRPSTEALEQRLADEGIELADGQQAEVCLAIDGWFDELDGRMSSGFVMVVDYGFEASDLYAPKRHHGSLLAYKGHRATGDYLAEPGERDLTAHVDFTALRRAAIAHGFVDLGLATQRDVLVAAGLGDVLVAIQRDPSTTLEEYTLVRSAVARLLDPRATGDFRVLLLGKAVDADMRLAGAR